MDTATENKADMTRKRIVLAGGSGFLGQMLASHLKRTGHEVVILTRSPRPRADGRREIGWDAGTLGPWANELDGAIAVINLAGRSVDCRYNARNRKLIIDSRVNSTRVLGQAILGCKAPPPVWLNSSSATIYKHSFNRPMDESGETGATPEAKDAFSVDVISAWEQALEEAPVPATRKVAMRISMVLGYGAGVFPVLRRLTRLGLGGKMGSGKQYVSWIHEVDFCRTIDWLVGRDDLAGPVNVAAPSPLPNQEMMAILRMALGVPVGLPATAWMLEVGAFFLRTETELILKSRRVVSAKLRAHGFEFQFPEFTAAVQDLIARGLGSSFASSNAVGGTDCS